MPNFSWTKLYGNAVFEPVLDAQGSPVLDKDGKPATKRVVPEGRGIAFFVPADVSDRRKWLIKLGKDGVLKKDALALPCGTKFEFDPETVPVRDTRCSCGCPNYVVSWEVR